MSRRHSAEKRDIIPDPKFGDIVVTKFMNSVMYEGKKSVAEQIVYGAFDIIKSKTRQEPLGVFKSALENVAPSIEVRSRRVGGATYQVPVEVRATRRQAHGQRKHQHQGRGDARDLGAPPRDRDNQLRIGVQVRTAGGSARRGRPVRTSQPPRKNPRRRFASAGH